MKETDTPGSKTISSDGIRSIKGGQKPNKYSHIPPTQKPEWLRVKILQGGDENNPRKPGGQATKAVQDVFANIKRHSLNTVCVEARCPNLPECFSRGTATFMILGSVCTRACRFCHVATGNPKAIVDMNEPLRVAQSVSEMRLNYVVITSVNRDDLADGGARVFAETARAIKRISPHTGIEVLTPDFNGQKECVDTVIDSGITVFSQNIETVSRLTHKVRDPRAGYHQTLGVLEHAAQREVLVKSSILLGLGEEENEVRKTLKDLRERGVDIVTLGQYLRPTRHHLPIVKWVSPQEFESYRTQALDLGFKFVASSPLVRSSYRAEEALNIKLSSSVISQQSN